MADIVTQDSTLVFEFMFVDGDTRTQKLKNPKATITENEIAELNAYIQANNLVIGDKGGATFGKIAKVTKRNEVITKLDIN